MKNALLLLASVLISFHKFAFDSYEVQVVPEITSYESTGIHFSLKPVEGQEELPRACNYDLKSYTVSFVPTYKVLKGAAKNNQPMTASLGYMVGEFGEEECYIRSLVL